jgi:ADP-ribose pyrophosphatase YjhB (NUDIX family)
MTQTPTPEAPIHRVGIIPFDMQDEALALLFVTSQTRGRWILPKGLPKPGESHKQACHREGFQEAGVRGIVLENFPLTVVIGKTKGAGVQHVPVTYYPFYVQKQEDDWPEKDVRERHWALTRDAEKVAYRDDFQGLLRQFNALAPWIRKAAASCKSELPEEPKPAP